MQRKEKLPFKQILTASEKSFIGILIICALVFGLNVFRGEDIMNSFLFAVALAVAAIPEALSSIVTIVLSFGTQKDVKRKCYNTKASCC